MLRSLRMLVSPGMMQSFLISLSGPLEALLPSGSFTTTVAAGPYNELEVR